jgi:acetylornithine deacetylase/succinyl-diaminopimelate desuccinylase-like protein
MTPQERSILEWLAAQRPAMLALLEELVNTDSGSYDKHGVDAVGARLRKFLESHGIAPEVIPDARFGDALRASVGSGPNTTILLMGHRDTVFPQGEVSRRPFRTEGARAYGPGVADMKPGLVMNAFVLAAFAKFGGAPAPLVSLFTGDEEIGSPFSRALIEAEARRARAVFNAEPGRPSGAVVTARKGGVCALSHPRRPRRHHGAHPVDRGHELRGRHRRGAEDLRRISAARRNAGRRASLPALCGLRRGARRERAGGVHRRLRGFRLCGEPRPTLCATGPVGGQAHTPEEYLELDSIVPRAQALALAILRLGQA